jgi:hypothetical protein
LNPVSGAGIRDGKYPYPGSGIRDVDTRFLFGKLSTLSVFFDKYLLKFFDVDVDPGSGILSTMDPGWKNRILDPEYGIRDKHPGTATLKLFPDP